MPKRLWALVLSAALVALPAVVLRGLCVGRSCEQAARAQARVPFCSLPESTRAALERGFRAGRSPDVLAVAGARLRGAPLWPRAGDAGATVPVVFSGTGVRPRAPLPERFSLDDVAPTVAEIIGLRRRHPEVRSGEAAPGVATGAGPRLVLEVVWEGIAPGGLDAGGRWPYLRALARRGAATTAAPVGSLPPDPAAVLATIGTGGIPGAHGITGTTLRNDEGRVVRAWERGAPLSVIATLPDDLDENHGGRARIGVVGPEPYVRGLVGGNWYLGNDHDDVVVGERRPLRRAAALLRRGYGRDDVPDLLAVVARGPARAFDRGLARLSATARRASGGSVALVVTATGGPRARVARPLARRIERAVGPPGVVEAVVPGGVFLDQAEVAAASVSGDDVVRALRSARAGGAPAFADAFSGTAVTFARYC